MATLVSPSSWFLGHGHYICPTSCTLLTLVFACIIFIGVLTISIHAHGCNFIGTFSPAGTSLASNFLLVPVDFLSFCFKPVSLGVRLSANFMVGHTP